ncbi:GlxA family transcriptional regulator [Pseudomonas citronellolis]|uniref:GlxA family transcriptional regulator n=1 Tax=Pseudomonas citronellolis TaxID=53408 RepID=UPI0023E3867C|nr:helix-turn-helix domain-containing protein [Pseudomonas citronellolis]MDF3934044.1 helix-turn-helix domain-containing protein [Pseudomonas citronellolis]
MPAIALYVCPQTVLSSLGLALDSLQLANRLAGRALFRVRRVSADGGPVQVSCASIAVDGALESVDADELLLIPATGSDIEAMLQGNRALLAWLRRQPPAQALGSLCSSAFLLAEAGQLDGRRATTHWALAAEFRRRYPRVRLDSEALCSEDGARWCSGGAQAGLDLCLQLIARHGGARLAQQVAGALVFDEARGKQSRFVPLLPESPRGALAPLLQWLEAHHAEPVDLDSMARRAHCSSRTLLRRFRAELGMTPNDYLQRLRMDAAREALADPRRSLERIANDVGYADRASFARLFKQLCGESPGAYRQRRLGRAGVD